MEQQALLDLLDRPEVRVPMGLRVQLARQVTPVLLVQLERWARLALPAAETPAPQVQPALPGPAAETRVRLGPQGLPAPWGPRAKQET